MDVQTCVEIVVVGHLRNVGDSPVGHLQTRNSHCHVPCRSEELTVLILQVRVLNVEQELRVVGSQVTHCKTVVPVGIVFNDVRVVWPGVAHLADGAVEVGVHKPHSLLLEDSVEELEHLSPQQFIVPVDNDHDILGLAEVLGGVLDVSKGISPFGSGLDFVSAGVYFGLRSEIVQDDVRRAVY